MPQKEKRSEVGRPSQIRRPPGDKKKLKRGERPRYFGRGKNDRGFRKGSIESKLKKTPRQSQVKTDARLNGPSMQLIRPIGKGKAKNLLKRNVK